MERKTDLVKSLAYPSVIVAVMSSPAAAPPVNFTFETAFTKDSYPPSTVAIVTVFVAVMAVDSEANLAVQYPERVHKSLLKVVSLTPLNQVALHPFTSAAGAGAAQVAGAGAAQVGAGA